MIIDKRLSTVVVSPRGSKEIAAIVLTDEGELWGQTYELDGETHMFLRCIKVVEVSYLRSIGLIPPEWDIYQSLVSDERFFIYVNWLNYHRK